MVNNTVDLTSKNVVNSIIEASTKNVPTIPGPYRGNYGLHGSTLSEIPPNEQFHVRNLAFWRNYCVLFRTLNKFRQMNNFTLEILRLAELLNF